MSCLLVILYVLLVYTVDECDCDASLEFIASPGTRIAGTFKVSMITWKAFEKPSQTLLPNIKEP